MKLKKPKFWDSSKFSFWIILFFPNIPAYILWLSSQGRGTQYDRE